MSSPAGTDRYPTPHDDAAVSRPAPPLAPAPGADALPGHPLPAPREAELPGDVVLLDGPAAGDPTALLPGLRTVLSRPGPAVVVATSGSTGRPKRTVLTTEALTASGRATERATAGPGQWLLCLPAHYVAGVQVLARSVLAGTEPVVMTAEHFTAAAFADAAEGMDHPVRYVSVVPTQLQRILDPHDGAPDPRAVAALARFDAVLVGGSALSPDLAARAAAAGVRVVRTYGMSETCGGCVYDGTPLDTVTVRVLPDDVPGPARHGSSVLPEAAPDVQEGRIWLGGDVVAAGYVEDPAQTTSHFRVLEGRRWYRTDDLGRVAADGTLTVLGRTDDVINTGGVKVSAGVVASVLLADERVRQALVVAVPHPEWGQTVAAVLSVRSAPEQDPTAPEDPDRKIMDREDPTWADVNREALERELAAAVRDRLGAPAVPRLWRHVPALPQLATGKPDRRAATALFDAPPGTAPGTATTPPSPLPGDDTAR